MVRLLVCGFLGAMLVATVATPEIFAQKKKVDVKMKWSGSVEDEKAMKPEFIVNAKDLEAVWKAWKIEGEMPKVDFTKELVVAVYSVGSKLNLAGANLDDKGNLSVLGFGTRDIRSGFRYVLATVSNDGVKSVNGKALPK